MVIYHRKFSAPLMKRLKVFCAELLNLKSLKVKSIHQYSYLATAIFL